MESNTSSAVNYQALGENRAQQTMKDLRQQLKAVSEKDLGRNNSLRRVILAMVVAEDYEGAKTHIQSYVSERKDFPLFQIRVQKYMKHATELVHAIQTKRNFPGLGSLALNKQQEINERVLSHFEELKQTLKRIERAERENKLSDLRGTALFVSTVAHCMIFALIVSFTVAMQTGLMYSFTVVFEALVGDVTQLAERVLGW
jgi:hypothetical protein